MPLFWFGLVKRFLFPVKRLESLCPKEGVFVDLGCGNGFFSHYLATHGPKRQVVGCDWDDKRLKKILSSPLPQNLVFHLADIEEAIVQVKKVDHFLISDVLYLLSWPKQESVLRRCYERLPQGGLLILKIADTEPRWKHWLECFQETVAVRLFKISKSGEKGFASRKALDYQSFLDSLGFEVTLKRLDRFRPHPHCALVCLKRGATHA